MTNKSIFVWFYSHLFVSLQRYCYMMQKEGYLDFDEYLVASEPHKRERAEAWKVAIGLQAVDGLKVSDYLKHTARRHIEGEITKEWVLRGDTVLYGRWQDLRMALDYDIDQERQFDYKGLSMTNVVEHLAKFISGIWQIHPFREGNTRTTAVFTIKYLQSIGFKVDNQLFEQHSWYFRNALVRANYKNVAKGISHDIHFLVLFFRNLLMREKNELKNRYLIVNPPEEWKQTTSTPTSTPSSTPSSSEDDIVHIDNANLIRIIKTLGNEQMSIKEMMQAVGLKDRKNFIEYTLTPAISGGYVHLLYPDKPHHPRQKYLLTEKGLALYASVW